MQSPVVSKSYKIRALAFATVLLISGMLVFTLLQTAQSAIIDVDDIGSVEGSSATVQAEIEIPQNERVPVAGVSAAIEQNPTGLSAKNADVESPLVERADCNSPTTDCSSSQLERLKLPSDRSDVITSISFDGFFQQGTGYSVSDGYFHTFATGSESFDFDGGYGYHPTAGFGYGGANSGTESNFDFGYGYGDGGLVLRYTITFQPSALDNGDYWFTFVAHTGSNIQSGLQSIAQSFTVTSSAGGGGGGGGDDGDGDGDGTPDIIDVIASQIDAPEGAFEAWRVTLSGDAGQTFRISLPGSERLPTVEFTVASDVDDAEVNIIIWQPGNPPEGVPGLPDGVPGAFFVQVTIDAGGTDHSAKFFVTLPTGDMKGLPSQAVAGKHTNPWDTWTPLDLTENTTSGKQEGSFTFDCCSTYAVAFDEADPTVSLSIPDGPLTGMVALEADVEDNIEVDSVEFFVGDTSIGTSTSTPYTVDWDTTTVDDGDHTLRAVAMDLVGNEGEDSGSATVQQADDGGPQNGDDGGISTGLLIFLIILAILVIGGAIWYFQSQKKTS